MKLAELKLSASDGLTLIAIVGLSDCVRPGVLESVLACQSKDITVRMVTGYDVTIAKAIAIKSGIISEAETEDEQICMEGG